MNKYRKEIDPGTRKFITRFGVNKKSEFMFRIIVVMSTMYLLIYLCTSKV